jgi:hypothetical protein
LYGSGGRGAAQRSGQLLDLDPTNLLKFGHITELDSVLVARHDINPDFSVGAV